MSENSFLANCISIICRSGMPLTLQIPSRTHEEFGHSLNKLLRILADINSTDDREIILDFCNARMLNPFFLGGLACMITYYQQKGYIFTLNHRENYIISHYLETICFPGCHVPLPGEEAQFLKSLEVFSVKTYIPIIAFPTGNDVQVSAIREKTLSAVSSILKKQLRFSERHRMPISYLIDEMTHNINDHARTKEGYVFAQYYPASNYIDICICDSGIGIFQSYQHSDKFYPQNEREALEFALNGRSTKDRPESKGFGISTSRDMLVNGLKGKFFIMSGNTGYIQSLENKGIIDFPDNFHFQGSYVALRVPTIIEAGFNMYDYVE